VLGALEQLSSKDEDEVGRVTHFGLLRRASHDEQLGGRVRDLDLADNGRRVRSHEQAAEMVDDELVAACASVIVRRKGGRENSQTTSSEQLATQPVARSHLHDTYRWDQTMSAQSRSARRPPGCYGGQPPRGLRGAASQHCELSCNFSRRLAGTRVAIPLALFTALWRS
jgi:hypothetical protein